MSNLSTIKLLYANATSPSAVKAFIREYKRARRWTKKAEDLLQQAFPNAYFDNNTGLNQGRSGAIRVDGRKIYLHKSQDAIRSRKTGYVYNRSRAWVINY
jgi:ABC-type nitrate/sulfonate/bicarbonate transport system substrate-binding protein